MDLIINRQYRIPFDRSISEHKLVDHSFPGDFFVKGHHHHRDYLRKENTNINSYHQDSQHNNNCESSSIAEVSDKAKDLRINHKTSTVYDGEAIKIKAEFPQMQRRYFCIFCKMDFVIADDFLEHLEELHPNGSFVLVKRDPPFELTTTPSSPTPHQPQQQPDDPVIDKCEQLDETTRSITPTILPENLQNQIKIEPISEDEEDEEEGEYRFIDTPSISTNHINNNNISPDSINVSEASDPNHQLMVLNTSSRIGDGPGEYLCNVCNAKFVYKNNLKSHLKRHLGIYPYVCFYPSCGKRYQFKCKLNKHIEQAHAKIKNFQCPVPSCPKKYFTRNDLAFHISVTHQERQEIPCHICKKVFNSQKSLQIHCRKYHRNIAQES